MNGDAILYGISVWAIPVILAITFHEAAHGFVASEQVEQEAKRLAAFGLQFRIARQDQPRIVARGFEQVGMELDARHLETGRAGLACAQQLAFAAQFQIFLGDAEAVVGRAQDLDARARCFAERLVVEQQA